MSTLEHRYRRIIRLYPAQHRRRFGDEMLDTLMQGAAPQQRFPRARELADLLWNAAWLRFTRQSLPSLDDSRWADATSIGGPLASAFLATYYGLAQLSIWMMSDAQPFWEPQKALAVAGWWLLTTILAAAGARPIAAAMAWLGTLGPLGYAAWRYSVDTTVFARHWPLVVLALTAALCLTVRFPKRRAIQLLGGRFAALLGAAFALVWLSPALQEWMGLSPATGPLASWEGLYPGFLGYHPLGVIPFSAVLSLAVTLLWLLLRRSGGLRRRLLAIAFPAVVLSALVHFGYEKFVMNTFDATSFDYAAVIWKDDDGLVVLSAAQWTLLLLAPPIVFLAALILVRRGDRREELIELGKAEHQRQQAL